MTESADSRPGVSMTTAPTAPAEQDRIAVQLCNEHGQNWPLWIFDDRVFDQRHLAPITHALKSHIAVWAAFFRGHFDGSWDSRESAICYNAMGLDLARRLALELGPRYAVSVRMQGDSVSDSGWVRVRPDGTTPP
jgi:hypothetical protein